MDCQYSICFADFQAETTQTKTDTVHSEFDSAILQWDLDVIRQDKDTAPKEMNNKIHICLVVSRC